MRVSFLELYNEELFDLLSTTEDNSKLRIFEDSTRKVSLVCKLSKEQPIINAHNINIWIIFFFIGFCCDSWA